MGKGNSNIENFLWVFFQILLLVPMCHYSIQAIEINWLKLKFYSILLPLSLNKVFQCPRVLHSTGHIHHRITELLWSDKWLQCEAEVHKSSLFLLSELEDKDLNLVTALNYWEVCGDSKMHCAVHSYEIRNRFKTPLGTSFWQYNWIWCLNVKQLLSHKSELFAWYIFQYYKYQYVSV